MPFCGAFNNVFDIFGGETIEGNYCEDESKEKNVVISNNVKTCPNAYTQRRDKAFSPIPFFIRRNKISPGQQQSERSGRRTRSLNCIGKGKRSFLKFFQNHRSGSNRDTSSVSSFNREYDMDYDMNCVDPDQNATALQHLFPNSTGSERLRFVADRRLGKSIQKMDDYMKWREETELDDEEFTSQQSKFVDDLDCWNFVVKFTATRMELNLTSIIPQIVRFGNPSEEFKTLDGKRVVQVLAALIDLDVAPYEFYSACIISYLHFKLDRETLETIVVLVDVRGGQGWKNTPALTLLPFIKATTKKLGNTMPERLDKCIVYPVPSPAKVVWLIVSSFLDPKHVEKIRIIWGLSPNANGGDVPVKEMKKFFDEETITSMEAHRISHYVSNP